MSKPYSGIPIDEKRTWMVPRWLKEAFVAFAVVAVGAACLFAGAISTFRHERPFENVSYVELVIAVGFVAHAMQTSRWLVAPAALFVIGSLFGAAIPDRRIEIFGGVWFVALTGVGLFLRRDGRDRPPASTAK